MRRLAMLREPPATARGARTRAALVKAARTVFEQSGYLDARLSDIAQAAQCSIGSFYTYFANKEEVFVAVLEEAQKAMLHPGIGTVKETDNPSAVLEASNRSYLAAYRRNAKLMGVLEQVAHVDPWFRELRTRRAEAFVLRNARWITDLQARSMVDPEVDPMMASRALSGMVSRLAYDVFVLGEGIGDGRIADFDELVYTVTRLWANALRFHDRS